MTDIRSRLASLKKEAEAPKAPKPTSPAGAGLKWVLDSATGSWKAVADSKETFEVEKTAELESLTGLEVTAYEAKELSERYKGYGEFVEVAEPKSPRSAGILAVDSSVKIYAFVPKQKAVELPITEVVKDKSEEGEKKASYEAPRVSEHNGITLHSTYSPYRDILKVRATWDGNDGQDMTYALAEACMAIQSSDGSNLRGLSGEDFKSYDQKLGEAQIVVKNAYGKEAEINLPGAMVHYQDPEGSWRVGTIVAVDPQGMKIFDEAAQEEITRAPSEVHASGDCNPKQAACADRGFELQISARKIRSAFMVHMPVPAPDRVAQPGDLINVRTKKAGKLVRRNEDGSYIADFGKGSFHCWAQEVELV